MLCSTSAAAAMAGLGESRSSEDPSAGLPAGTPLSMTSALLQASPLVVTAGAALFLGETVGWRRWASILIGFAGVLVILEPWDAAFDPTGLLTVACVVVLAVRDLATRVMPARIGTFQVATWAYLGLVPAGALLMAVMGQTFVIVTHNEELAEMADRRLVMKDGVI